MKGKNKQTKKKQTLYCTLNQTNPSWVPIKKEREAGRPPSVTPKIFIHRSELREGQRRPIGVKCPVSLLPFPFFTLLSEVFFFSIWTQKFLALLDDKLAKLLKAIQALQLLGRIGVHHQPAKEITVQLLQQRVVFV